MIGCLNPAANHAFCGFNIKVFIVMIFSASRVLDGADKFCMRKLPYSNASRRRKTMHISEKAFRITNVFDPSKRIEACN
jgi:hypothetical protein